MKQLIALFCYVMLLSTAKTQVTIWSENFTGYPNCTTTGANNNVANPAADWTTIYTDCDDAVTCTPGQNYWGTFNGEFRVNDIEGGPCTCGGGGTNQNYITSETIDISSYYNVSVSVSARYVGTMEAGTPGVCDNSGDLVNVSFSLDGGPFTQFAINGLLTGNYLPNPSVPSQTCLNGSTLVIRVEAGNKANNEDFYIDNMLVEGFLTPLVANAGPDDSICPGGNIQLNATGGGTYTWNPSASLSCTNCANPIATPPATETFIVTVSQNGCDDIDSVTISVLNIPIVIDLGNDTLVCGGSVNILLDATQPGATYLWQDASTNPTYLVTAPGTYYVTATNACGSGGDTIVVTQDSIPVVNLGNDTAVCPGMVNILLDATQAGPVNYLWQDNSTNPTFHVTSPGIYSVTVSNACGIANDALQVTTLPLPAPDLGNDTLVCTGMVNFFLDATMAGANYLWQDGSSNSTFNVTSPGIYYVTVSNTCGSATDTIHVQLSGAASVNLGPDQVFCNGGQLLLDVTTPFATSYTWQDGSNQPTFNVTVAGLYYVTVTTACNIASDSIVIFPQLHISDTLDLLKGKCGSDSITVSLQGVYPGASFLWSNGDVNSYTNYEESGNYYVMISYCNSLYTDSFEVLIRNSEPDALYMPNAFTPNEDEINPTYRIGGIFNHTISFKATIFNRWGMEIYSTIDYDFVWNGTFKGQPVEAGVYYMLIEMQRECEEKRDITIGTLVHVIR